MEKNCKEEEKSQWYMCIFMTLKSLLILRLYQTIGYFLGHVWFEPISELLYKSIFMITRFWKVNYIFGYGDKLQIVKQSLYFALGHLSRYFVCFITWIEYTKENNEVKKYRYRIYNCLVLLSYLTLIVIELLKM